MDKLEAIKILSEKDCFNWIRLNKLQLSHGPWDLMGHEYQKDWLQCEAREQCFIKGAQIGATEALVLKTLFGLVTDRYPTGALYLFPTRDDVRDFSKSRFDPLIQNNDFVACHVKAAGEKGTDAQNIKKIGKGYLYLRGAKSTKKIGGTKESSSQLKSIPADRIVFDERDEISDAMVELARHRVMHSKVKEIISLGTPTIPDYGMDALYKKSDQRVWMIKCGKCAKWSSIDLEFPNSIGRHPDGTAYRRCIYCDGELNPMYGRWEAQYPSKSKDLVGWWISQLNSVYVDPTYIIERYENPPGGDLSEIMNSNLGRAYIPAENRLTPQEMWSCQGDDPMLTKSEGPCCMGVDVGAQLHVVIAQRKTRKTLEIIKMCRVSSFNDLHDLARDFNVKSAVIDLYPETRKVREFQRNEHFSIYGCQYVETRAQSAQWDDRDGIIKCNRTEVCDASHEQITTPAGMILPRRNQEVEQFVKECCNIAKVLEEDVVTGSRLFKYKKLGPDHYRHALNYCILAAERVGTISDRKLIKRFFGNRARKTWLTA